MSGIICGIDLGTSKVAVLIGALNHSGEIEVLGRGIENCTGVKKGAVVDIENVTYSIKSAIKQAETMSNISVESAFLNIAASQTVLVHHSAAVEIFDREAGIRPGDLERVLDEVRQLEYPSDKEIVDVIPKQFSIDGLEGIKDPLGMKGNSIGVEATIVLAKRITVENMSRVMDQVGVKIDGFILDTISLSDVVLSPEEKEFGTVAIDVGGSVTELTVFKDSEIIYNTSVALGGESITRDLSIGLKVPIYEAERLKREYQMNILEVIEDTQPAEAYDMSGRKVAISVEAIAEIIEARGGEIVRLAFEAFRASGIKRSQMTGVVMTGGGISYLDGCIQVARSIFELPVRIPSYKGLEGVKPEFISCMGLLRYAVDNYKYLFAGERVGGNKEKEITGREKKSFMKIFRGIFHIIY